MLKKLCSILTVIVAVILIIDIFMFMGIHIPMFFSAFNISVMVLGAVLLIVSTMGLMESIKEQKMKKIKELEGMQDG